MDKSREVKERWVVQGVEVCDIGLFFLLKRPPPCTEENSSKIYIFLFEADFLFKGTVTRGVENLQMENF
jgi:hypothetical protein